MFHKPATSLIFPTFLAVFLASAALRGEDVIMLDDNGPQPTATPVPAAIPPGRTWGHAPSSSPNPAPAAAPTNTPTPLPTSVPAKTPSLAPTSQPTAAATAQSTPVPTEAPGQETNLSESQQLGRRIGVLPRPVLWFVLDGNLEQSFESSDSSIGPGFGLSPRVELQFLSWLSMGTYYDLDLFPASQGIVLTGPLGLMARVFPWGQAMKGELTPFVIGGGGINSLVGQNSPAYPGNFHAFIGVGAVYPFGDGYSLDLGLTYNIFSSEYTTYPDTLQAIGGRGGLAYSFEP